MKHIIKEVSINVGGKELIMAIETRMSNEMLVKNCVSQLGLAVNTGKIPDSTFVEVRRNESGWE